MDKARWMERFVGFVHAVGILLFCVPIVLFDEELSQNRVLGFSEWGTKVYSASTGYFLWDTVVSIQGYMQGAGIGFVIHGVVCFFVYLFSLRPYLQFYAPVFLMFELSTPFLHALWALDTFGYESSTLRVIIGVCLVSSYFMARIVFGFYQSYFFYIDTFSISHRVPGFLLYFYACANVILCTLNLYWFGLMLRKAARAFGGAKSSSSSGSLKSNKKK